MPAPDQKTLQVLFGEPPVKAMRYLADKDVLPTKNWHDILDNAHNQSFVVANLARIDILNDIKQSLIDAQAKGQTLQQWRENITPTLQAKGWWGKGEDGRDLGTPYRLETIYRTNLQAAYMAGRRDEMLQAVDTHPYWRYVAVMDSRTRPAHRSLNGKVMPANDPAWDSIFPPNGWNCRCRVSPMTAGALERGGYTVESSDGYLEIDAVGVGDGKSSATITKLKLPSMNVPFKTDAGFNAAPTMGATRQLIQKTAPDIVKKLPEHPVFTPQQATVDDFVALGQQRLKDVLDISATDSMTVKDILDSAKTWREYREHHNKFNHWVIRELERTRQAGTILPDVIGSFQAKGTLYEATKGYPADWIKSANDLGVLNVKYSKHRGWALTANKDGMYNLPHFGVVKAKRGEGFMVTDDSSTAVHEYAHRIQEARHDIDNLFQQEHRRRTAHESLQRLYKLYPGYGYGRNEVARPDGYYDAYMGKEYAENKGREALEVMTMSIQPVLGNDSAAIEMFFKLYHQDRRMLELAIGILFHCK